MRQIFIALILTLPLAACAGNVRTANQYGSASPVAVVHPYYDPYSAYGSVNATWEPPVYNRQGTIVAPREPSSSQGRPDYEHSIWATGASGGSTLAPPGTF
jgi:hypothetical protein